MKPATCLVIDFLGNGGGKTDNIMIQRTFQFLLARHQGWQISKALFCPGLHALEVRRGHGALLYQRLTGEHFNLQPEIEFVFVSPNRPHIRARIPWNHTQKSLRKIHDIVERLASAIHALARLIKYFALPVSQTVDAILIDFFQYGIYFLFHVFLGGFLLCVDNRIIIG